jgi:16S rRNA (adenine1518-N6/adenine1519-N6)-dimethyltransferase
VSEELFDVVNERDEVLYPLARSAVHRQLLLHRAVHVFVLDSRGRLLIHRRSPVKEEFPNVWTSSCSGHVSAGETYDETAPRELAEELGITGVSLERLQKFAACAETSWEFTVLYRTVTDQLISPDAGEMTAVAWVSPGELDVMTVADPDQYSPAFLLLYGWYRASFA